jgi:polygalacturonase
MILLVIALCAIAAEPAPPTAPTTTAPSTAATSSASSAPSTAPTTVASTAPTTGPASRPSFDVKSTGAIGDGQANDTAAVQKAIDDCAESGGGVVSLPAGAYRCGSLFLKSHVTLQVESQAVLLGSTDDADYPIIDTRIAGIEMPHPAALVNAIDC